MFLEEHNLPKYYFFQLIHALRRSCIILKYKKTKSGGENRISVYDYKYLKTLCNRLGIDLIISDLLGLALKLLRRRYSEERADLVLDLWTENPDLQLFDYQKDTVSRALKVRSMVIADTLGLGKTNQCIATICESITQFGSDQHIVVAPSKLLTQWHGEFIKFTKLTTT